MTAEEVILYGFYAVTALIFAAAFLAKLYLLWTMSRCLSAIHPRNRTLAPGLVWLELVPLFNWVWGFILVKRVNDSLANEYDDRRWGYIDDDYGQNLGYWAAGLPIVALFCGGAIVYVAYVVLGVMYYRKIDACRRELLDAGDADYSDYDGDGRE